LEGLSEEFDHRNAADFPLNFPVHLRHVGDVKRLEYHRKQVGLQGINALDNSGRAVFSDEEGEEDDERFYVFQGFVFGHAIENQAENIRQVLVEIRTANNTRHKIYGKYGPTS